jgi:hypothetical protein
MSTTPFDFAAEELLTISQAARLVAKHPDTVKGWIRRGKGGVKLEVVYLPGGPHTSRQALARFMARLRPPEPAKVETPAAQARQRKRQTKARTRARQRLEEAGWA